MKHGDPAVGDFGFQYEIIINDEGYISDDIQDLKHLKKNLLDFYEADEILNEKEYNEFNKEI